MPVRFARVVVLGAMLAASLALPRAVSAQEESRRLGGHVGFVVPLVTRMDGVTTTVADDFVIGFPSGFGLKTFGRFKFDLEVVPAYQNQPSDFSLLIHPGVVAGLGNGFAGGLRMAFDVEGDAWGFTPLLNRAIYSGRTHSLFGELVVPIRFVDYAGGHLTSVGFGVHIGIGF
jgi:hypothetical protein